MATREILFGNEAQDKIAKGVNVIADAVGSTMGPCGHTVMYEGYDSNPTFSQDGVTVARNVELEDPFEKLGADAVKGASQKTNEVAGDGPQPLHSRVLTPKGWVTMGEVKEGMEICGTNGTIQKVVGVYEKGVREIYAVTLTDGRTVECCEDHLWSVTTKDGSEQTRTVRQLVDSGRIAREKNGWTIHGFYIKKNRVQFRENAKELPLDPYLLGVLLGDGSLSGTGSIELSLGFKKRGIIKRLKLPNGTKLNEKDCEKYIRIKLNGESLKNSLKSLKLYGTKSGTKFIPKAYLYSDIRTRESLLRGLLDTDGHINQRGLFEFSTVSPRMATDFAELCLSLGYELSTSLHTRENDSESYSRKPIFRIVQLKGGRYGMAIDSIEPTGRKSEMRCIKVSNPDNLYVTDGYVLTHNTTTAAVLARAIYVEGRKRILNGENPTDVKSQIEQETSKAVAALKQMAVPADTLETLERVATISSKDPVLGKLIAGLVNEVGKDGLVSIEVSPSLTVETEITRGMKLDTGFVAPWMITNPQRMNTVMEECPVLVTDTTVGGELVNLMNELAKKGVKKLFIVADGFTNEALSLMFTNGASGKFVTVGIRASGIGDKRKVEGLLDICAATGATLVSETTGRTVKDAKPELLGSARQITVNAESTVIVEGSGKQEETDKRLAVIRKELEETKSEYDKMKLKERISRLTGTAGVVKVGGINDAETKERRDRVEDAVNAVRSAQAEGIIVGGGISLLRASEGCNVILRALEAPLRTIAENAGKSGDVIVDKCKSFVFNDTTREHDYVLGYNAATDTYENLIDAGVIDPLKVTRTALENASAVAGLLLLTDCAIINKRETK